jgi:hypothetical protein
MPAVAAAEHLLLVPAHQMMVWVDYQVEMAVTDSLAVLAAQH